MGIAFKGRPDLTAALGCHGIEDYVRTYELPESDDSPSSPEEALRMQEERLKINKPSVILLYNKNGETVLDTFTIGDRYIDFDAIE